jgi:hypothetical protein
LQLNIVALILSRKEKLIARFLKLPKDFHYDEVVKLLGYFDFEIVKTGKTSGSRIKFENSKGIVIRLHKPHPGGIMKQYQLRQLKEILEL